MSALTCELCPRGCTIPEGASGDCRVRVNLEGKLIATTYGRPSAVHIDPIEKKPFYHFHPGTTLFSVGTAGCNLHCLNCQNWQLSQRGGEEMEEVYRLDPPELVQVAKEEGCLGIAFTYSDPVVFFEYVADTGALAHAAGLVNTCVTAAYIQPKPLRSLCRVLDACHVDLKAFDEGFYRQVNGATLKPVLDALVILREEGVWIEITNLMIPTLNDDLAMIRSMAHWVRDRLGPQTPLHFSRFQPLYRMRNLPPTPTESLERAQREAQDAGLEYVYVDNVLGHAGNSTRCPSDGTTLIRRVGFMVVENRLTADGRCPTCNQSIPGVWK